MLSPLSEPFGFDVLARSRRAGTSHITFDGLPGHPTCNTHGPFRLQLAPTTATVLGREDDGNPVFTRAAYGKGVIYFLSFPMEQELTTTPGSFHTPDAKPCWQVYEHLAQPFLAERAATKDHPQVGITEHVLADSRRVIVLINYSPEPVPTQLTVVDGWKVSEAWYGQMPSRSGSELMLDLTLNDAAVLLLER
jgi:hypothetical protein